MFLGIDFIISESIIFCFSWFNVSSCVPDKNPASSLSVGNPVFVKCMWNINFSSLVS